MLEGNILHTSQFAKDQLWAPDFMVEAKRNHFQLYNFKEELCVFSNPSIREAGPADQDPGLLITAWKSY